MAAHVKVCDFRLVADCPCGVRFRHCEKAKHQSTCVAYQSSARKRAEAALSEARREARTLRAQLDGSRGEVSVRARGGAVGARGLGAATGASRAESPASHLPFRGPACLRPTLAPRQPGLVPAQAALW